MEAMRGESIHLSPTKFTQIQVPIRAVANADALFLVSIGNFFEVHALGNDVDQQIAGDNRNDARAQFGAADVLKFYRINRVDVADHASDSAFVILHRPNKM